MTDNPFALDYVEPEDCGNVSATDTRMHTAHAGPVYHNDLEQGSLAWLKARCGLLTASEMKLILTPTLKMAANDKQRAHLYELAAQRITKYVEPQYISDDMLRGQMDEIEARELYAKNYSPVTEVGFVTNDRWGFTLGYSPDGLVGDDGLIECKSRRQKYQVQTLIENVGRDQSTTIPVDYLLQHQTGLLVTKREWIDFISYSGGLPMAVIRVWPDDAVQSAIIEASAAAEVQIGKLISEFNDALASNARLVATERKIEQEMFV